MQMVPPLAPKWIRVLKLCKTHPETFQLCLPESFEWLILKSGIIHAEHLVDILENPGDYIESQKFFSWENFFEDFSCTGN